jgi:hypothetical protein
VAARAWRSWAPLGFGLAALAACWNPVAAPFGLVTGLGALVLSARQLRRGRRAPAALGLACAILATGGAAAVLALSAGVGREAAGTSLVPQPPPAEVRRRLDEAAAGTREARDRAAGELRKLEEGAPSN